MELIRLPETKLNELAQGVSQRLLEGYDFEGDMISGEALKSFSSHNQINKFLIFQVFQVWDMQINKLNHPYFNLDREDIQATLTALKNQISQHIEISKDDFKPMLERAVYNNLKLLLSPKDAFSSFFFANHDEIPLDLYQRYAQFFSDLDFVVNSIFKFYQKNDVPSVEKEVFFQKMDKVLEIFDKKSEKGFDSYRSEIFQNLTQFSIADIQEELSVESRWEEQQALDAKLKEQEEARKQEEEKARQEEEAKRVAEEERQRLETEAAEAKRLQEEAEAEAKRLQEEAEAEAKRLAEEERLRQEEEARKKEAEKMSFFDTIGEEKSFFDLDLDEEASEAPTESVEETIEEVSTEEEVVAPIEEVVEVAAEPLAEVEEVVETVVEEKKDEFLEMAASMEPEAEVEEVVEEIVEKKPLIESVKVKQTPVEEVVETIPEEIKEEVEEVAEVVEPKVEETESDEDSGESTVSFLDRFLSKKTPTAGGTNNGNSDVAPVHAEVEKPASVLDRINEGPKTIVDQLSKQQQQQQLHQSLNGNRKIKLDEIPIHKQYQYVQKVFEGNNVRFRIIVDKVNNAKNKEEVEDILSKFVLSNDAIDTSDAVVGEFIELLRNRF